ncbi:sulfotransferase [Nocardioides sp. TF02-7]|uniref:sulfotransferase n=1 Tax=Nocardioides sp. TF02-7 TaxID=2917724 RepID=UPI001F058BE2|nr:sulfotransferase [Nocardioides sp. TF02-7]
MLAEMPGVVVLGELRHMWERGIGNDELCACSTPFSECPFWRSVGDRAFGGWDRLDVERVLWLKDTVDRKRRLTRTTRRRTPPDLRDDLLAYTGHYRRIYEAAAEVAGASVVVDSSKVVPLPMALSHDPAIDLRIAHIVRDPRGVAYSWQKSVARPEKEGESMPRIGLVDSTQNWVVHNMSMTGLRYRGVPVHRLRYEDLVRDPGPVVRDLWRGLRLPGSAELPLSDRHTITLNGTHSVAGNPMRFRTGETTVRPDTEWVGRMNARDRRAVTALSLPLLKRYGYPARVREVPA